MTGMARRTSAQERGTVFSNSIPIIVGSKSRLSVVAISSELVWVWIETYLPLLSC